MEILTGNELMSGATVYLDREGRWVEDLQQARVFLKEEEVTVDTLVSRLTEVATKGFDERIYVRGDRTASYGTIMLVMGTINGAGFRHIGLVALGEAES